MSSKDNIVVGEGAPRRIGVVETATRDKTRKVTIQYVSKHPKYGKYVRKRTVLQVHDAKNETGVGDRVEIAECVVAEGVDVPHGRRGQATRPGRPRSARSA